MKFILAISLSIFATSAFAKHKHSHRQHDAHQHGHGEASIAFDGTKGKIEFKAPGESIAGFEHRPKNPKQTKQLEDAFSKVETKMATMIVFEASLECKIKMEKIEMGSDGLKLSHGEVRSAFDVTCAKSPVGSTLTFDFAGTFPKLKEVDVTVLADSLQKQIEVKEKGGKLELKK